MHGNESPRDHRIAAHSRFHEVREEGMATWRALVNRFSSLLRGLLHRRSLANEEDRRRLMVRLVQLREDTSTKLAPYCATEMLLRLNERLCRQMLYRLDLAVDTDESYSLNAARMLLAKTLAAVTEEYRADHSMNNARWMRWAYRYTDARLSEYGV